MGSLFPHLRAATSSSNRLRSYFGPRRAAVSFSTNVGFPAPPVSAAGAPTNFSTATQNFLERLVRGRVIFSTMPGSMMIDGFEYGAEWGNDDRFWVHCPKDGRQAWMTEDEIRRNYQAMDMLRGTQKNKARMMIDGHAYEAEWGQDDHFWVQCPKEALGARCASLCKLGTCSSCPLGGGIKCVRFPMALPRLGRMPLNPLVTKARRRLT